MTSDPAHCMRPHVYAVALRAFRALERTGISQACVISGESGAGKTETAKYFISHLLGLSRSATVGVRQQAYVTPRPSPLREQAYVTPHPSPIFISHSIRPYIHLLTPATS
jgi:Cdc6-like AAA superfamily ATPase